MECATFQSIYFIGQVLEQFLSMNVGGYNPNGAMQDVLEQVDHEKKGQDEQKIMVSLKYDVMYIRSKIKCNPHTMEVVKFANDSFDFNVLVK